MKQFQLFGFSMHPRPYLGGIPTELLMLVGKIAIQSTYLDLLLGVFLAGLKNVPPNDRSSTIFVIDTRRKVQKIKELVKSSIMEKAERAFLLSVLKRAGELLADGNLAIHAIIAYKTKDLTDPIYVPFRGQYVGKEIPVAKETLEPIFNEVDDLCRALSAACSKHGYVVFES